VGAVEADSDGSPVMPRIGRKVLAPPCTMAIILMLAMVVGCSSSQGFDRPAMIEALHAEATPIPDNQPLGNQNARLSPPFRLAVFFAHKDFPNGRSFRKVEWLTADREQLLHQLAPLRDGQILADIFVLMDATVQGDDSNGIKRAAARYGADLVLFVDGIAAVDRHNNRYAWLYPIIIGAYLAPGTESDALVMITGSLWAVHSEWRAPIQTVEGISKLVGSAVLVEDTAALSEAKKQALHALGARMVDQLQRLK
jgi:hypothetical protein